MQLYPRNTAVQQSIDGQPLPEPAPKAKRAKKSAEGAPKITLMKFFGKPFKPGDIV